MSNTTKTIDITTAAYTAIRTGKTLADVLEGRAVRLLWASPDCTFFFQGAGSQADPQRQTPLARVGRHPMGKAAQGSAAAGHHSRKRRRVPRVGPARCRRSGRALHEDRAGPPLRKLGVPAGRESTDQSQRRPIANPGATARGGRRRMMLNPRLGQRVTVWYRANLRGSMPLHARAGIVRVRSHNKPRNHGVEIDGRVYSVPCGNLRRAVSGA